MKKIKTQAAAVLPSLSPGVKGQAWESSGVAGKSDSHLHADIHTRTYDTAWPRRRRKVQPCGSVGRLSYGVRCREGVTRRSDPVRREKEAGARIVGRPVLFRLGQQRQTVRFCVGPVSAWPSVCPPRRPTTVP